jgi:hypothetical protein
MWLNFPHLIGCVITLTYIRQSKYHLITMSSSTTTAAEQINMDTLLPTYLRPRRAHTFPSLDPQLRNSEVMPSSINANITTPSVRGWFTYLVGLATIVGLVVAIVAVVVK